ncbi:MAG: Rpn family recombination-promoting nuclease/putative transposase [Oscillospiraceae bacterium]|nr:Rpn family recombination-promoting nuclease/putative transposase [Oscillospiraceae bacterium]
MSKEREIIPVTNDVMFKALFVRNPDLLKSFLVAALNLDSSSITNLKIRNTELTPDYYEGKLTRLDILLETDGKIINIEMQVARKEDYKERALFYWARMYNNELKEGETYDEISRCICINVLNFTMFECSDYHSSFSVREDTRHELLTDRMQIHFLELPKVEKISEKSEAEKEDTLQLWMQLFKAKSKEELEVLKTTTIKEIQTSVNVIYDLSEDEQIRERVRQREKAEQDYYSDIAHAKAKGKAEGLVEGAANERTNLIAKWKAKGKTEKEIQELLAE